MVERRAPRVEDAALALLAVIEPKRQTIRDAAESVQATVSIGIWWDPEWGQGGFSVSTDVMRRLLEFGERLDVYFPG